MVLLRKVIHMRDKDLKSKRCNELNVRNDERPHEPNFWFQTSLPYSARSLNLLRSNCSFQTVACRAEDTYPSRTAANQTVQHYRGRNVAPDGTPETQQAEAVVYRIR